MKIALLQTAPLQADPAANRERALILLQQAADGGADLAVLPECAISGYAIGSRHDALRLAEAIPGPSTGMFEEHCARTGTYLACGLLERAGETIHNTAVLIGPRGLIGTHRKTSVADVAADAFVTPGGAIRAFDMGGVTVGLVICYELRFPEVARALALQGAQILINVTNWPAGADVVPEILVPCRAVENHVHLLACDRAGEEGDLSFIGRSAVHGPDGGVIARAGAGEEVLFAEIMPGRGLDVASQAKGGYVLELLKHRRPELYHDLTA